MGDNKKNKPWFSWMVLAATFLTNLLSMGFLFGSVGVLTAEYNKTFGVDVRSSSWVGSVLTGVLLCSGPFAAYLIAKFGCRSIAVVSACTYILGLGISAFATQVWHVILSYSVLSGFAGGCCHVAIMKILPVYFQKYQHVAFAVAAVGADLANVVFPFITQLIFNTLPYKYGILCLTAALLPIIPSTAMFKDAYGTKSPVKTEDCCSKPKAVDSLSPDTALAPYDEKDVQKDNDPLDQKTQETQPKTLKGSESHIALLKKPAILVYLINTLFWNCGGAIVPVLAYSFYLEVGFEDKSASTGMSYYGLGALAGSITLAIVSVKLSFNRLIFHWVLILLLGIFQIIFPLTRNTTAMAAILCAYGMAYGTLCSNLGSLSEHIVGSQLYKLYAYQMAAGGIGGLIGPIVAANLQKSCSSEAGFFFGGASCFASLVVMVTYACFRRSILKHHQEIIDSNEQEKLTQDVITKSSLSLAAYI